MNNMKIFVNYLLNNPGLISSFISSITLLIITFIGITRFQKQKELESKIHNKEYLQKKRIDTYELLIDSMKTCLLRRKASKEDYIVLIQLYKENEDVKLGGMLNREEYQLEKKYLIVDAKYSDAKELLNVIFDKKAHINTYTSIQNVTLSKGIFMSEEILKETKYLEYLLISSLYTVHWINLLLKKYNHGKKDYEKFLRPKVAFIMKDAILEQVFNIQKLIESEFNSLEFEMKSFISDDSVFKKVMMDEMYIERSDTANYLLLLIEYCADNLLNDVSMKENFIKDVLNVESINEIEKAINKKEETVSDK